MDNEEPILENNNEPTEPYLQSNTEPITFIIKQKSYYELNKQKILANAKLKNAEKRQKQTDQERLDYNAKQRKRYETHKRITTREDMDKRNEKERLITNQIKHITLPNKKESYYEIEDAIWIRQWKLKKAKLAIFKEEEEETNRLDELQQPKFIIKIKKKS